MSHLFREAHGEEGVVIADIHPGPVRALAQLPAHRSEKRNCCLVTETEDKKYVKKQTGCRQYLNHVGVIYVARHR